MLIAIEGIDGTGKATQTALLAARVGLCGLSPTTFSFPRYGKGPFGALIGKYLNGELGDIHAIPAYLVALLFAGDRFSAREELWKAVRAGQCVVCDRYVASNLAYQGAKLPPEQWEEFFALMAAVELGVYDLPRPDVSIYLDMPVKTARRLVARKKQRSYTELVEDAHERDEAYLERCAGAYRHLIERDVAGPWCRIACSSSDGEPLAMEAVADAVWACLEQRRLVGLPAEARSPGAQP